MAEEKKSQEEGDLGSKTLKAAREVRELRYWYYHRLNHAHDYGEFVALSMLAIPNEILMAFGVWPSLCENYGPACAAKQVSGYFCEIAETDGFSMDLCSYMRTGIGYLSRANDLGGVPPEAPYGGMGQIDMIVAPTTICDGRYKYPLAARRYLDVPYFIYDQRDLPWWRDAEDPEIKNRYVNHNYERMKELVAFLERTTGKKFDESKLSETLDLWMKAHTLFRDCAQFKRCHPNPFPSQDSFATCFPNLHIKGTKECVDYYQRLYDELKYKADNKIGTFSGEERFRIFWGGFPPWMNLGIFKYLQDMGVTTIDTTYDPGDMPEEPVDLNNPLYAIAKKFYEGIWFANGRFRRGRGGALSQMTELEDRYDIDGRVSLGGGGAVSCRFAATQPLRRAGAERSSVPFLRLDADMADSRFFDEASVKAQLDIFLETMEVARQKRKQGES